MTNPPLAHLFLSDKQLNYIVFYLVSDVSVVSLLTLKDHPDPFSLLAIFME